MTDLPPDYVRVVKPDGSVHIQRRAGDEVCDFCLGPTPVWTYPAAPMPIKGHPLINATSDPWAVCQECHELIEAHNVGALVERVAQLQPVYQPANEWRRWPPLPLRRRHARENVLRFMDARLGPPWRHR